MLTGAPRALVKDTKKQVIIIKGNIFNFLWIDYTIFNTIVTIQFPFLVSLTGVPWTSGSISHK